MREKGQIDKSQQLMQKRFEHFVYDEPLSIDFDKIHKDSLPLDLEHKKVSYSKYRRAAYYAAGVIIVCSSISYIISNSPDEAIMQKNKDQVIKPKLQGQTEVKLNEVIAIDTISIIPDEELPSPMTNSNQKKGTGSKIVNKKSINSKINNSVTLDSTKNEREFLNEENLDFEEFIKNKKKEKKDSLELFIKKK